MIDLYVNIVKIILVLVGIVAALFVVKRYAGKFQMGLHPKDPQSSLKKVDTMHLGYKKFISVVEIGDNVLVIGAGDKEMSLLAKWKKEGRES